MRTYHIALAVMLISTVFLLGCIEKESDDLILEIKGLESSYKVGESIDLDLKLTNNGDDVTIAKLDIRTLSGNDEGNRTLNLFISTPEGYDIHIIEPTIEMIPLGMILFSNKSTMTTIDLTGIAMGRSYDDISVGNEYRFGPGSYSIYAVYTSYQATDDLGKMANVWKGSVRTDTETFRITGGGTELELDPLVKVTGYDYTGDPRSVPYQDIHDNFSSTYSGSDLDDEFRDAVVNRMSELAEDLGENGSLLIECILATYDDPDERPSRIPTYAEKCVYNGEQIWALAFNRCNGWEDGIGHFDLFFVSIPVIESGWVHGCNATAIAHCDGCY